MSKAPFRIELLQKQDRTAFDCGEPELNTYFQTRVPARSKTFSLIPKE